MSEETKVEYEWREASGCTRYIPKDTVDCNIRKLTERYPECKGYVNYPNKIHSDFYAQVLADNDTCALDDSNTETWHEKNFDAKEEAMKWVEEMLPQTILEHYNSMIEAAETFKKRNYPS